MKAFINWYKGVDPFIKFLFYTILIIVAVVFLARGYYYHQIGVPQEVPDFATTSGVVSEAANRNSQLSLGSDDPEYDYEFVTVGDPGAKAHAGLAGYFIPENLLDDFYYYSEVNESFGQSCWTDISWYPEYSDGNLVLPVETELSSPSASDLCKVDLPNSITAFEVIVSQGADEKLYYIFKEVTLPVKYVLNIE